MSPVNTPAVFGRRSVLSALAAGGAGLVLAGCGSSSGEAGGSGGGKGWTFTDDAGNKVSLPERPTRIAGFLDVVAALWNYGIEPVAAFGYKAVADAVALEGKDTSKVTEVGRTYGQINVEALAASSPDLIVTKIYPEKGDKLTGNEVPFGFTDHTQVKTVSKVAPIVCVLMTGTAEDVMHRTNRLAKALGVDFASPRMKQAEQDYQAAGERLQQAAGKGLTVMAEAAYASKGVYIAKPADDPALAYYAELGVDFVEPGGDEYYWHVATWEEIGRYRSDVILNSTRAMGADELGKQPTFASLPAYQAGQVYPWHFQAMDYVGQGENMNQFAGFLEKSKNVTG